MAEGSVAVQSSSKLYPLTSLNSPRPEVKEGDWICSKDTGRSDSKKMPYSVVCPWNLSHFRRPVSVYASSRKS